MNNFAFKVYVIRNAGNYTLVCGKYYSGALHYGEKIQFFSPNGSSNLGNTDVHAVGLTVDSSKPYDELLLDIQFSGEPYYAQDKPLWIIDQEQHFSLVVGDTFSMVGRGLVVTGTVSGILRVGDDISIVTPDGLIFSDIVIGLEKDRKILSEVHNGDSVGVLLKWMNLQQKIPVGSLLCKTVIPSEPVFIGSETHEVAYNHPQRTTTRRKVALLIGNCNYLDNIQLKNCISDARLMGEKLQMLGFDTILVEDGNKKTIDLQINRFGEMAANAEVGLVFYSGHGIQYRGENYIIPTDAQINTPSDINYKCNNASYVLSKMQDVGCHLKILVLDACRTNPFARGCFRGDMDEGLCNMGAPSGTLVAFATSPNSIAYDGNYNGNSPYTYGLIQFINNPNLDIVSYFNKVSSYVYQITNKQQTPWFSCSALTGDFYLAKRSDEE